MSVDNPEHETPEQIVRNCLKFDWLQNDAKQYEQEVSDVLASLDAYYKAQASKDLAEVIGKDYEADLSKLPHAEFAVRVGANYEKGEMRKRATSKGYEVEEENLNG